MAKTGRNDPCVCGSGKKYKQCCLAKSEQTERAALAAANATTPASGMTLPNLPDDEIADELADASNAVIDMIHAGNLDEAERAARQLLERFPKRHDGYDRLGMVYQARRDSRQAAECYRKVIALVQEHPGDYDPGFEITYQKLVDKLDPPAIAAEVGPSAADCRGVLASVKASTPSARTLLDPGCDPPRV